MSTPMERLRQLVGTNNWDYCVLWKLSEDQSALVEQGQMSNSINNNHSFSMNMNIIITELQSDAPISDINDQSQAALPTLAPAFETLNISSDSTNNNQSMSVIEQSENGVHQTQDKQKVDQLDDNDEPQSKNFEAERKRREKLTEQLFILRSLVPNISKLDKASIIGDAITYIEELQKEARDLQDELERNFDDEYTSHSIMTDHHQSFSTEISNVNDCHDQAQQMEVQVEVGQLERNNFYVKVFGEQERGGFVRLMEALNCLGLEIIKVNMTNCISLVSYDFIVKKRDSENVPTEYLRDSLLEATRSDQTRFRSEMRNRRKLVPESNTC